MPIRRLSRRIKVMIIEDHPLFREGLEKALSMEEDIFVIGFGKNGGEGLSLVNQLQPEVVVLDVNLPDMNGLQVAQALKSEHPEIAVVMLTAYHDNAQVIYAMRAGASAYCAKDISPDDLIQIIRDVANAYYVVEGRRVDRDQLEHWIQGKIESIIGPYAIEPEQHFVPLSPRETEILQSVTRGMSNKEIATDLGISQQTVKNHMTSILRKLNVEDRTQAAVMALRHGWVRLQQEHDVD